MDKQYLTNLVDQGLSIQQLATETNKSKTSIRYWLKKFNLKTRLSIKSTDITRKLCYRCNKEKDFSEFYKEKDKKTGCTSYCKRCVADITTNLNRRFKKDCLVYKGSVCQVCGYNKCDAALEFHHLDPTQKDFSIADSGRKKLTLSIQQELDKCVLLCSNCHRELHNGIITIG